MDSIMKSGVLLFSILVAAGIASAQGMRPAVDDDDPCPRPGASVRAAAGSAPTREGYLQLVAELRRAHGQKLDAQTRGALDQTLAPATRDGYGSDLGAALLLAKSGSAAVYAITWSASRDPNDALTANNLGVALKGLKDYQHALPIFLYAQKLAPDNPLTLTNLAWVRIALGDGGSAQSLFQKALDKNSKDAVALAGLGLLAQCRGNRQQAEKYARESLKQRFLPIAAGVINAAEDTSGDSSDSRTSQPNGANSAQPGSASSAGAGAAPFQNPRGKQSGQGFELPDPPFDGRVADIVAGLEQIKSHNTKGTDEAEQTTKQINDLAPSLSSKTSGSSNAGNSISYPRTYDKEQFVLGDMRNIYSRHLQEASDAFGKEVARLEEERNAKQSEIEQHTQSQQEQSGITKATPELNSANDELDKYGQEFAACIKAAGTNSAAIDRCTNTFDAQIKKVQPKLKKGTDEMLNGINKITPEECEAKKQLAERLHPQFYTAWQNYWTRTKKELSDYYGDSSPWIEDIQDPDVNKLENLVREQFILAPDLFQRQLLSPGR